MTRLEVSPEPLIVEHSTDSTMLQVSCYEPQSQIISLNQGAGWHWSQAR